MQALFREDPRADDTWVDRSTQLRLTRQRVIENADRPACSLILHEGVLRQRVGGPDVMREQFRHLSDLSRSGVVDVRVYSGCRQRTGSIRKTGTTFRAGALSPLAR